MRKHLLLFLCLLLAVSTQAQTTAIALYGTITEQGTGNPVPNHSVYISTDSLISGFTYFGVVQTDINGFYVDTITVPTATNLTWYINTLDCNNSWLNGTAQTSATGLTTGNPTDFTICANSPGNCQVTYTYNVNQFTGTASFAANITSATYPLSLSWDFGDGSTAVLGSSWQNHTYLNSGTYIVCVTINDATGCTDTYCDSVVVNYQTGCIASFSSYPDTTPGSCDVYFQDYSTASSGITSWNWNFGDGTTGSTQYPIHTYGSNGTYTTTLTIGTSTGCTSTTTQTVQVTNCGTGSGCSSDFVATPTGAPNTFSFTNLASGYSSFMWYFHDGTTSTATNPTKTYAGPGSYFVALILFDANAQFCDSTVQVVSIAGNPSNCQALFQMYPDTSGYVQFLDSSMNAVSWFWDFGDGTTSTNQHPSHIYANPGPYAICLTITDGTGCSDTYCDSLYFSGPSGCVADFSATSLSTANTIAFSNLSSGGASYYWYLGDGNVSTQTSPTHTYALAGSYIVILQVLDSNGQLCDSTSQTITVGTGSGSCQASFYSYPDTSGGIQFIDSSISAVTWSWDFGDGNTSTSQFPFHVYSSSGPFIACLTITDGANCVSTYCDSISINVNTGCSAYFNAYNDTSNSIGLAYQFASNASGGVAPYTYSWDFGDGSTGTGAYPVHVYGSAGAYQACLTVTDATGCQATYCQWVSVMNSNLFFISGFTFAGNGYPQDYTVFLITFDSTTNLLTAIDSVSFFLQPGDSSYYSFTAPAGYYTTKAALFPSDPNYWSYIPTYYGDEMMWSNATFTQVSSHQYSWDIDMIAGTNPGGPGFIGGNVFSGANKSSDGVAGAEIILLDMNDSPIAYTYSDADGAFGFDSLAYGTYKIHTEVLGLPTTPVIVTISAANPSVTTVEVEIGETAVTTSIDPGTSNFFNKVGKAYPNPTYDRATLDLETKQFVTLSLKLQNAVGQVVQTRQYSLSQGSHSLEINLQELPAGIYLLNLSADGQEQETQKLVKF